MKHLICIFLFCCLYANSYSQEPKFLYCEIVGTSNLMGTKVTIVVDYGEQVKLTKPNWIRDAEGKIQKFNSMIDALNFMGSQGWEFVQAFAVTSGSNTHVYHFLLKREVKADDSDDKN